MTVIDFPAYRRSCLYRTLIAEAVAIIDWLDETQGLWSSSTGLGECTVDELTKRHPGLPRPVLVGIAEDAMRSPVRS